jgi:hypothetical protein
LWHVTLDSCMEGHPSVSAERRPFYRYLTIWTYNSIPFCPLFCKNILDLHQVFSRPITISSTVCRVSFFVCP